VAPCFFSEKLFLLATEKETGKIIKKFCGVDLLKIKKNGNYQVGEIPLHNLFYTFAHTVHSAFAVEYFFCIKKVRSPEQVLRY